MKTNCTNGSFLTLGKQARRGIYSFILPLAVVQFSPSALAQQAKLVLEEVVVTATKRAESLRDVSLSVAVLDGKKMADAGIENADDIGRYIPNTLISSNGRSSSVVIRGLGSGNNRGFESSVGLFIDGVYYGRDTYLQNAYFDLERVEVVRGPQGTLFGKNTIAGAINITTANPDDEFGGYVKGTFGDFSKRQIEGAISLPLSDTVGLRLSVQDSRRDGYVENTGGGPDGSERETTLGRAKLRFEPNDRFDGALTVEWAETQLTQNNGELHSDASPLAPSPINLGGTLSALQAFQLFDPRADDSLNFKVSSNEDSELDNQSLITAGTFNLQLGEATLTYVIGYSDLEVSSTDDSDFAPYPLLVQDGRENYEQWNHELRLTSPAGGKVDYIAGLYYFTADYETSSVLTADAFSLLNATLPLVAEGILPRPLGLPLLTTRTQSLEQESDTFSAFGQLTWSIADNLRFIGGLRYSKEDKDADNFLRDVDSGPIPLSAALPITPYWVATSRSEEDVLPSLAVEYDFNDDVLLYASYTEGVKSGGFNPSATSPDNLEYEGETAGGVEAGFKARLLDGAASLNFTVFRTEFDDLQVSNFNGTSFVVGNAAEATVQGIEADFSWLMMENLRLDASFALLDAQYDEFPNAPCTALAQATNPECAISGADLGGEDLLRAPAWSANLGINYAVPLPALEARLTFAADVLLSDSYFVNIDLDAAEEQDSYALLNARIILASADQAWQLALIGRNLTDQEVLTGGADVPLQPGAHFAVLIPPRQLEISLSYQF
ncbi:MAG: iron complex outermembrane receptor protein [Halioglobus sp.]|jgi:outer membrane receptor protein involved in Fe transport